MRFPPYVRAALVGAALLAVLPVGTAMAAKTTASATTAAPTPAFSETFSGATWYRSWGRDSLPWHTSMQTEGANRFLRVLIGKGQHNGTSFFKTTGNYDAVTMRYRLRLGPGWDPSESSHNVKLPGFGNPVMAADGVCLAGCGGAAGDGVTGYSARSDVQDTGVPGSYLYDLNPLRLAYGRGLRWNAAPFQPGRWYTIELRIAMNTPGAADGVLQASVDGVPVLDRRDITFRLVDTLHVGAAWFDFYYGGTGVAPADTTIDVDDVTLYAGLLP